MEFYYLNLSVVKKILLINQNLKKLRNSFVLQSFIEQLIDRSF